MDRWTGGWADVHAVCKYDDSLLCIILPQDPRGNA